MEERESYSFMSRTPHETSLLDITLTVENQINHFSLLGILVHILFRQSESQQFCDIVIPLT
jgi:hypothetical protein